MKRYRARGSRYRQKEPYSVRRVLRGYPIGRMGGGGGYRPRINPYSEYGLHYSPRTKYIPQTRSTEGYLPNLKKNEPEKYLPGKAFERNQIDTEQILRELEKRFDEKLLEKMNNEFEKREREAKKAYTEIDAKNDAEIDNNKKESIADRIDPEEKDDHSGDIAGKEEKSEAKESIEDKEELLETDEGQEVEVVEDVSVAQNIESELEGVHEEENSIESLPENINEVESLAEIQENIEQAKPIEEIELPIEPFDNDIEELYSELYEIEEESIEQVEPVEETEGY